MKSHQLRNWIALLAIGLAGTLQIHAASKGAGIDFAREIRPILSDNCFACHGPDEKARKGKLRLDVHEDALKEAKSGEFAIVPGHPAKGELLKRINTTDEDDVMPPPKSGKKLTQAQKDLLKRWIAEGANWQSHWAYETPMQPSPPKVKNERWPHNEIDRFILARLEKEKLSPNKEADRVALIRRVTLDLTGMPPTPEEVDAFLADRSQTAYEKLVDRLLQSPRYGEHLARYWLDAARYADSHGYHIDSERSLWKWRDWVVEAFNQNMPFDQFTVEQLAGDLLPNPTVEQKIGSGYVRCNMSTGEGGAIVEEYQAKYTFDRVETTATIWMGLTLTCARCHTHKYDPITHKEYYGLYAFFNNLNESVMDGNKPNPDPFLKIPSPDQTKRLDELKDFLTAGRKKLDTPMPELDQAQPAWEKKWHQRLSEGWSALATDKITSTNGTEFKTLDDKSVLAGGENPAKDIHELVIKPEPGTLAAFRLEAIPDESLPKKSAARSDDGGFRLSEFEAEIVYPDKEGKAGEPKKIKIGQALADSARSGNGPELAIDAKPDTGWQADPAALEQPHAALFVLADPLTVKSNAELRVRLRYEASVNKRAIGRFRLSAAQNEELVDLLMPPQAEPWQALGPLKSDGLLAGLAKDYGLEKEFIEGEIDLKKTYPGVREEAKWSKKDYEDGKQATLVQYLHGVNGAYYLYRTIKVPSARQLQVALKADEVFKVWLNGKPILERTNRSPEFARMTLELKKGVNKLLVKAVNHEGESFFSFKNDLNDPDNIPADIAALFAATSTFNDPQKTKVKSYYRRAHSPDYAKTFNEVEKWLEEETAIDRTIPTTMVAKDMDKPRDTMLLVRGEYDKPGEKVTQGVPSILPPFPKDEPTNRLGLARWLLDPSHPLTARVTVNRFWQQYFGVGLVKTTEDFGVQSEPPSHPELLDWLATEFVRTGWDVKGLQKLIVTSAAYRQSSKASPELLARDPENRLLARGPRFRVDGEVVRDMALFVSGLLIDKRGGRSVKPYEPSGLWEAVSFNNSQKYVQDMGDGQHRRSLYTHWKRQSPPPNMLIFDAPTREYCVVRRPRTNTPLQALALLNDQQFVEASRSFAQRMLLDGGKSAPSRITYGFRLATARKPTNSEIKVLEETLKAQLEDYRKDNEAAEKLLKVGSFKNDSGLDKAELAAWTTVASMILNLDETLTKQ